MSVNHKTTTDTTDSEMNPEKVVGDFFDSLDESADEPEEEEDEEVAAPPIVEKAEDEPDEDDDEDDDSDDESDNEGDPKDDESEVDWEKRYKDQQSFHDQQMAATQAQLAELQAWAQQSYQSQLQMKQEIEQARQATTSQASSYVSDQDLATALDNDAQKTFVWVAQNRPDLVPKMVAMTRQNEKLGHEVADEMMFEYQQYQTNMERAERARIQQQIEADRAQAAAPAHIEEQMIGIIGSIKQQYGAAFDAVEDEFVQRTTETADAFKEYLDQQGLELTPDAIHYFLTKTFNDIREEKLNQKAAKPKRPRKMSAKDHIETSTQGLGDDTLTADELAINEIIAGAKELSIDTTLPSR